MKAVWGALKEQVPMVKKYWGSGAELMSLLANEEIYATVAWSGRVAALQAQGHPIAFLSQLLFMAGMHLCHEGNRYGRG